jgi:hypothetical protein
MMLAAEILPRQAIRVPYTFPPNAIVKIQVFATQSVNVYVVDAEGLANYTQRGEPKPSWFVSEGRLRHAFPLQLPPRPQWFLLITNPSDAAVTVNYDATVESPGFGGSGPTGVTGSWGGGTWGSGG